VCAYELDGGCRDKNPACSETDDDFIGCTGTNASGYFYIGPKTLSTEADNVWSYDRKLWIDA